MELIIIGFLILLNGFFALSEISLVSSKKSRLEQEKLKGHKGAGVALKLQEDSENFLSAIQVGITLIGIVTGVYGGVNIAEGVTPLFERIELTRPFAAEIALISTIVVITYFSIVIGELVPKSIALNSPENIAKRVAPVIHVFSLVFYPFVKLLSLSTNFVTRVLGIKKQEHTLTEAELRHILRTASLEGVIEKEQNEIHENVFYFSDKKARHVMTDRRDVEWLNLELPKVDQIKKILACEHMKIVCSEGKLDNIKGILYLRDFYKKYNEGIDFEVRDLIVEPLYVHENIHARVLVNLFRQKQTHFSCVIDENGSLEGIITLHDIMESVLGVIPEEGEVYEPHVFERDDKSILVSGDAPVEILASLIKGLEIDFETIEYSTVAGFVFFRLGKIPKIGDKIKVLDYSVEVIDIDRNRIDKVLIRNEKEMEEEEDGLTG